MKSQIHCSVCNEVLVAQEEIAALGHSYEIKSVGATCTEDGYILYTCSACGDSYTANGEAAFGHTYVYTDNGENHIVSCSNCDYSACEAHSYVDGTCVCGAVESTEPEYELDTNLSFITMCVDMLNYGAAAQIRLDYSAENLVNADLAEEQKALATQAIPEAVNNISTTTDGSKLISSVSLQSKVLLYLNSNYAGTDASTLKYVIKDAESGKTLDTLDVTQSGSFRQAVYSNVGAKQMRQLLTIALYDGKNAVSQTLTWSIESYVASVRAKTASTEAELNMVNAMLTCGDSVAAYMTASGR